jgi:hypothetical protein
VLAIIANKAPSGTDQEERYHFFLKIVDLDSSVGGAHEVFVAAIGEEREAERHVGRFFVDACGTLQHPEDTRVTFG